MAKAKTNPLTPEQQAEQGKQAVIEALRKTIADLNSKILAKTRAADTLGRGAEYSWFSKPQDPSPQENQIDNPTAQRFADLAERLLGNCAHCGKKL